MAQPYRDRCFSSLASFFLFRFASLSFFFRGLGFPASLVSPLMLLMGSPPYLVHEDERSNLFCCLHHDFKMARAEYYVVVNLVPVGASTCACIG